MGEELDTLPAALREQVEHWFERFGESAVPRADLARIVACSEFAGNTMLRERDWFVENVAGFSHPPDLGPLAALAAENSAPDALKSSLRRFRNRYMLHVLWREVFELADLDETLASLSALADRMLAVATEHAERELAPRFGEVRDGEGRKVPLVIVGMGKLGGLELNFSSDIDLIFLYPEDGQANGPKRISAQEYFGRLCRKVIALLDERTEDGFVFRIDTRLRPFGESGPPVVSFDALESYLLHHGRDWERYAYVKARVIGPDPGQAVVDDLYDNLIRPFVYRRYVDYGVFESLREMHALIAAEVKKRELQDNVKLGPGGIREAEFVVQSLQLVRGGSEVTLQARELQQVLPLLVNMRGLTADGAERFLAAYRFMRRLENFIQAMHDRQTHDLPEDEVGRSRLRLAMRRASWDELAEDIARHRAAISAEFARVAFRGETGESELFTRLERTWKTAADADLWTRVLEDAGFEDAAGIATTLVSFAGDAGTRQVDAIARERLQRFIPRLIMAVARSEKPRLALARTLHIVQRVLRRSAYLSLLNENQAALARLVDLCGRSTYIADQIARFPVLLDELLDPRMYSNTVTRADLGEQLRGRLASAPGDSEERMQAIAQFQRSTMFRIAVADFSDKLPIMKVSDGLTWLAETILEEALRVAWRDLTARHGVPRYTVDGTEYAAGFGIVAYGKLGGLELSYGSDLDVIFLHDSRGTNQVTDGDKPLDNALFFGRLVRRLIHFLTMQTGSGQLYEVDMRLRPDGRSGLLVTSTEAFERYQVENAWTWEHQALLRARPVAGSPGIEAEFERIRRETLVERVRRDRLRDDVVSMRQRMRSELDRSDDSRFDLKHGRGGIGDIEFLVQYLVLENAREDPAVIHYSDNIRQLDALVAAGFLEEEVGNALQDAYRDYRLRYHHLVLDDQPPFVGQDEFVEQRDFVSGTWDRWLG
ncbi:MAG: bifunctional [glutamate--ammonia ligase]-adenylyl-L-tyrosine phosphorylase/[glutamate--ammonia-ligase] adenylyltransferase [Woeseiaceae bacterium]